MEIQIDPHTLRRAEERGTNENEIKEVLENGFTIPAKHGRKGIAKIYDFEQTRNNQYFPQKRVEVVYVFENA